MCESSDAKNLCDTNHLWELYNETLYLGSLCMGDMSITWTKHTQVDVSNPPLFPDEDGVYVIASCVGNQKTPIYVGQGDITTRIMDHIRNNHCSIQQLGNNCCIYYTKVESQKDRENIEYTLYCKYRENHRLCNDKIPSGVMVTIDDPLD